MDEKMLYLLPLGIALLLIPSIYSVLCGQGRELLYLQRNALFNEYVIETISYSIITTLEFILFYRTHIDAVTQSYLKYIVLIYFFAGVILFAAYQFKNLSICILISLLLYIYESIGATMLGHSSIFEWHYNEFSYMTEMLFMFILGTIGWITSYQQNKQYQSYDDSN